MNFRDLNRWLETNPRSCQITKLCLFVGTIIGPMLIFSLQTGRWLPILFLFFPVGLSYFFFHGELVINLIFGWLVYLTLVVMGVKTRRTRWFLLIYLLLITAVLLNIKGCAAIMADSPSW